MAKQSRKFPLAIKCTHASRRRKPISRLQAESCHWLIGGYTRKNKINGCHSTCALTWVWLLASPFGHGLTYFILENSPKKAHALIG